MIEKQKVQNIINNCIEDRRVTFIDSREGFIKKYYIDICAKFCIFLINSLFSQNKDNLEYYFIDEVKNRSMSDNLRCTYTIFANKKEKVELIPFFEFSRNGFQISKMFILVVIFETIILGGFAVLLDLLHVSNKCVVTIIVRLFIKCISKINLQDTKFVLMSDYHFFSSIIATCFPERSIVIQHGLKIDDTLCYPIRAGYYLAWGKRSKELMYDDKKVIITGTYKYDNFKSYSVSHDRTILFCVGNRDYDNVIKKIDCVLDVAKLYGWKLIIKCHPGSLYSDEYFRERYLELGVEVLKEQLIQEIGFDIVVTESSTAIIDFIVLDKPFVVYDEVKSYFGYYKGIIPVVSCFDELKNVFEKIEDIDFNRINKDICLNELNDRKCTIYETIKSIAI